MIRFLEMFVKNRLLAALVVLANIGGVAFGFYYYLPQFAVTSPSLFPFVADSPIAAALFAAALFLAAFRRGSPLLSGFAFVACLKVGLWTVFAILLYGYYFLAPASFWYYLVLLVLHAGMFVQAFLLLPYLDMRKGSLALLGAWFLLNDFLDYFLYLAPYPIPLLGNDLYFSILAAESFAATAFVLAWFLARRS